MPNHNQQLIKDILKLSPQKAEDLASAKRKLAKKYKIKLPLNSQLISEYQTLVKSKRIKPDKILEKLLRRRKVRTLSGVAPIAVLTKPYPCPGKCLYCPTERKMPKSYLSNEPAVMRAIACNFNPYEQVKIRIKALTANGHPTDKIELIVMGGTWSYFPEKYQLWFIKECFRACNNKNDNPLVILRSPAKAGRREDPAQYKTGLPRPDITSGLAMTSLLKKEQKKNETAKHRIVGLTLETRPDFINIEEIKLMRQLGATKIELGVQTLSDSILKLNQRGHSVNETIGATKLLKQAGFKICYHLMLNLYGSTPQRDLACFKKLFSDSRFQPDLIKIYPTVVTKNSGLYRLWREKKYRPYNKKQLTDLIIKIKKIIPPYVRIIRIIRDIPSQSIIAGSKLTNLRQLLEQELKKKNIACQCIRCRESKDKPIDLKSIKLVKRHYPASEGQEYFLSYESKDEKILYAFARLREQKQTILPELKETALIRELHTYGQMVPLKTKDKKAVQHLGLGKKLMIEAEKIARQNGFEKIAVIAGIGVRQYYRKLGYRLTGTYMVKNLS